MKRTRKYFPALATATLAAGLAVATTPVLRAQAQSDTKSDTNASSTPQASVDTQQRLQDLEKEVLLLQKEIVSMKDSETPSMKTAAYVQPAAADASAALTQAPAAAAAPDAGGNAGISGNEEASFHIGGLPLSRGELEDHRAGHDDRGAAAACQAANRQARRLRGDRWRCATGRTVG